MNQGGCLILRSLAWLFIHKALIVRITLVCIVCLFLSPAYAHAINFATGAKAPPGYQLNLYPFYYSSDTRTDKDGNPLVSNLGLKKQGVSIGNNYYISDFLLNAVISVGKLEIDSKQSTDAGLGDIQLRVGWQLPVEWASFLPALMVKVPSGSYDKTHPVNISDGQADVVTELYFFKLMQPFSFDAVFKYAVRFRNAESDVTPGNEFTAEGLVTWRLAEKIRVGPAINYLVGGDNKRGGKTLADSGLMRLSAGGELWYGRFDHVKISLAAYQDVLTRNTNEGVTVMSRIAINF